MPQYTFAFVANSDYAFNAPNFAIIPSPPIIATDNNQLPTEVQLQDFITKLHNWQADIVVATDADICTKLQAKVRNRIFAVGSPNHLIAGTPIIDVYVNTSRESGDEDMWRDPGSDTFAIHPTTNNYAQQGPINIGVAQHPNPAPIPSYWMYADVIAYKV